MTNYTSGDWTVSDQYTDAVATPKNISVPDLSYSADYVCTKDEAQEAIFVNTTSTDVRSHESIRFAASRVSNVYQGIEVASQAPTKQGQQVMAEVIILYKAVNSVTGEEYEIPFKGRIVLRVPTQSYVTADLVQDGLNRTISAIFATGGVDETRAVNMIKGILKP